MTDLVWVAGAATFCGVAGLVRAGRGAADAVRRFLDLDRRAMAATHILRHQEPADEDEVLK